MTTSAQRKLARGVEQVKTLRREALAFQNRAAYVLRVARDPRGPQQVECRCFVIEREAPSDEWPLLAGEAIHNLRSALDHAVWRVWKDAGNGGTGDRTQFPIALSRDGFESQAGRYLQGVPKPIRALIEGAQPFNVSPNAPARDPLELLRTFSNIDKHRALTAVASAVMHEFVGLGEGVYGVNWSDYGANKTLGHGETYISTFIASAAPEVEAVKVEPGFTYEVRIEGVPLDLLKGIVSRVFETVNEVETGKPKSPGATYPI